MFRHPDELMANMRGVTDFLKKKIALEGGDPERNLVRTRTQMKLVREMKENAVKILEIIANAKK